MDETEAPVETFTNRLRPRVHRVRLDLGADDLDPQPGRMFLPYAGSAFVPVGTMPSWIRGFAENQPVTPVTESIRSLLRNQPAGSAPWLAVAWCGGILVVSVVLSTVLFRRRTT